MDVRLLTKRRKLTAKALFFFVFHCTTIPLRPLPFCCVPRVAPLKTTKATRHAGPNRLERYDVGLF